jgi:hypothetical protein
MQKEFDPRAAFEALQQMKESGKVQVSTEEPAKEGDPITLTVTSKDTPEKRSVYVVNANTKLVERMTICRRRDGQWQEAGHIDYLEYNKGIDPQVFQLDLPKDVITVDRTKLIIGLEKGDLTDNEIAAKVAREFFEAIIAGDYAKAGLLLGGMPAERMKEAFGRVKYQRIVEVGTPAPGPIPEMKALQVPITIEYKDGDGKVMQRKFAPFIRSVYEHPERWEICGGI